MSKNYYVSGEWNFICSSCKIEQNSLNFYIHSNGKPRKQCKKCLKARAKKYTKAEKNQFAKNWVSKNKEKAHYFTQQWRKNNLAYDAYRASIRRSRTKLQCPKWANKQKIKEIYYSCPKEHHVDHIIPLKGKLVSGLHVEYNLQYLPAKLNLQKGNKYAP